MAHCRVPSVTITAVTEVQRVTSQRATVTIVERGIARFLCACARYAHIRHSGIILTPRLPLCQISFLSYPPLLSSPCRKIVYSITHSLTGPLNHSRSLFDVPGTQAFASELFVLEMKMAYRLTTQYL